MPRSGADEPCRPQDFDASSRGAEGDYTVIDPRLKPLKKKHKTLTIHNITRL